ncbi:ApaLI family restriction endonuclease [Flammeovirga pectinis]|uniref:ApaLI family restriction endonuclease n=1 Tax=Flammeovirga pectinis TaxID=2494373 RepID=A0A3Q9FMX0_9BACT|nr:ApaLI family restriction endonuclease [Flammeovirga pectinis]AZQ60766.1 ApaLI family restriction endonuclease [Flammeovirga pectinis]
MIKIERLKKAELVSYCEEIGINTSGKSKDILIEEAVEYGNNEINKAIKNGNGLSLLTKKIEALAEDYSSNLDIKIQGRKEEMKADDNSHYLIYRVLGISQEEGRLIDEYQNTGRFLYKYAGSFLEEAATICLKFNNTSGSKTLVKNNQGTRPKTFEIDFLDNNDAIEIKWRDATTDGDHITKEHTRVKAIESYGYTPIRVMFYYPQREQAKKIQETLKTIYDGVNGKYFAGDDAWNFIAEHSGYDLKKILVDIANKRTPIDE